MITGTITPPPLEKIRATVRAVCEGRGVARVDLFGSVARGEGRTGSDVDLLVEFLPDSNIGLFEMGALKEDLEDRLGCKVDLLSRRAVESSRNPYRFMSVDKQAALLRDILDSAIQRLARQWLALHRIRIPIQIQLVILALHGTASMRVYAHECGNAPKRNPAASRRTTGSACSVPDCPAHAPQRTG